MGYFPFFVDIAGKEGLIVGGGIVALRKIEKLLPFAPQLTVAAPEILPEIEQLPSVTALRQSFTPQLLEHKFFVIAATDDPQLNHTISGLCRLRNIPVNVVDDKEACSFLFPALIQQGRLTVGISTGGASPSGAKYVKQLLLDALPEAFPEILDYLADQRDKIQSAIGDEAARSRIYTAVFSACMQHGRPLKPVELSELLSAAKSEEVRP